MIKLQLLIYSRGLHAILHLAGTTAFDL